MIDTGCFLTVPPKLQCKKDKHCSTNEDLLYIKVRGTEFLIGCSSFFILVLKIG